MGYKTSAVIIMAALGIPLFPLGAHLFLAKNEAPGFREEIPAARDLQEIPAAESEAETLPPPGPEILARVFRRPDRGSAGEKALQTDAVVPAGPVPGEGKFSFLGLIRESGSRERLCVKEEETGRVIFVDPDPAAANEEHRVFTIEGVSYSIGRN